MTGWFVHYMRGSQNLSELTDVATARTNLDVYSKSEALAKANNLSDVPNKETARTNLEVYSKSEALTKDNNLSELTDKAVARTNLDVYSKSEVTTAIATPDATETTAGKAKIATTAIAQAGLNDTDFLTAKKLRDALNAEGAAPISACRAWVCFDSTTAGVVIRASDNIQSIVRTSVGKFVITFVYEMPHSDYIVLTGTTADSLTITSTLNLVVNEAFNVATQNAKKTNRLSVMFAGSGGMFDSYGMSLGVFC